MSMQHALEVRSPLLDTQFAEIAMGLTQEDCWAGPDVTKKLLKEIAWTTCRGTGCSCWKAIGLLSNAWAKADVIQLCGEVLDGPGVLLRDHLDSAALKATVKAQSQEDQFSIYQMWPLLILELWLRAQPAKIQRVSAEFTRAA